MYLWQKIYIGLCLALAAFFGATFWYYSWDSAVYQKPVSMEQKNTEFIDSAAFFVDTEHCKTSPLAIETFQKDCRYLAESFVPSDTSALKVRAVQQLPTHPKPREKIEIGKDVFLEFYKDDKKLNIPFQLFHTYWATDYLALSVSYLDDENIYVSGSELGPVQDKNGKWHDKGYFYFYNGKIWEPLPIDTLVQKFESPSEENDSLSLYVSPKNLKIVKSRGCFYDPGSDNFYLNDKYKELRGTTYTIDRKTFELVKKEDRPCVEV